jgi:hypothetical protein
MANFPFQTKTSTPYTNFTNLSCETLKVGGVQLDLAADDAPDWFIGQVFNPNTVPTVAMAKTLAQKLAQKLATYLVQYSVVAKNCLRLAVPAAATSGGGNASGVVTVPSTLSTGQTNGGPLVPYLIGSSGSFTPGNAQLSSTSGTFPIGTTVTVNPAYMLRSDALIDFLARSMAIGYLDSILLALYAQFTTNTPVGTAASGSVSATILNLAITEITGQTAYLGGAPVIFVLSEAQALSVNTVAAEPDAGFVASNFVDGRRRFYSGDVLAEILVSELVAITSSTHVHGIAFCPSAIGLATAPAPSPTTDPNSTTPLTTSNIVSSAAYKNFVASVRYGLTPSSGNLYAFNVNPFGFCGVIDNPLGVRVES